MPYDIAAYCNGGCSFYGGNLATSDDENGDEEIGKDVQSILLERPCFGSLQSIVWTSKSSPVIGQWRDIVIAANPKGRLRYAAVKSSFYLGVSGCNVSNQSCFCRGKSRTLESCEVVKAWVKLDESK